jgi:hypothetical protein
MTSIFHRYEPEWNTNGRKALMFDLTMETSSLATFRYATVDVFSAHILDLPPLIETG